MSVNFQICPYCKIEYNIDLGDDGPLINANHNCQRGENMGVTRLSEELTRTMDDLTADAAKEVNSLSADKQLNLAAYLKYSFGPLCRGMEDGDWLREADTILSITQ